MTSISLGFAPVRVLTPPADVASIPLVLDSPHSGTNYPADFDHACPRPRLRQSEDTDVDDLYGAGPSLGATLVCALFPRSYIDVNRRAEDLDTDMIAGRWPHRVDHSPKTKSGIGLIWRLIAENEPIYARKLSVAEVEARIANCHVPYWAALRSAADEAHRQHGKAFHINCHSMPEEAGSLSWVTRGTKFADVVLGDRDGSTCSSEYTQMLRDAFRAEGLSVAINDPYKGVEIVKQLGKPREERHSIQIELNRRLYMNEKTRERTAGYAALKASVGRVLEKTKAFVSS
jgi:N-formylglutamate deformylase